MIFSGDVFEFKHSAEHVRADFERFRATSTDTFFVDRRDWLPRHPEVPVPKKLWMYRTVQVGQLLSEYHHWKHRSKTATMHFRSAQDVLDEFQRNSDHLKNARERIRRVTKRPLTEDECIFDAIRTNSALMTLTHFRASVSKHLCDLYGAKDVLDFSAGWGDRLTGFLAASTVTNITLIDPRPGSLVQCREQHAFVGSTQVLTLLQRGAEEVMPTLASSSIDLVISSPPYFNLEHYGETEHEQQGQIRNKVSTVEDFKTIFLAPVLYHSIRVLRDGGVFALNLDDNPKAHVYLCDFALEYIRSTFPNVELVGTAGLRKGAGFGQGINRPPVSKAEPIYIFRKHVADRPVDMVD